jgi:hypothetical protein
MATLKSTIQIPEDVYFRDLDGEAIILNTESGKYYGLDEVGTRMWHLLAEHGRVEPAYQALLAEYEVDEERLERDLLELVDELVSHGLMETDAA